MKADKSTRNIITRHIEGVKEDFEMDSEMSTQNGNGELTAYTIMPRNLQAQITEAVQMRDALAELFRQLLEQGKDYDRIPGTDKPTLLKPGAEMLCKVFRLSPGKADMVDKEADWERGIFAYTVGMPLIHIDSGKQVSYGIGAANNYEKKYRYRKVRDAQGNQVQVENPDPADTQNTLLKMASKRAFVDAALKATGASRMFTQDMEDLRELTGTFETASSRQLEFIKKLFSGVTEREAAAEISRIAGREISGYADIRRQEAGRIIEVKKNGGGAAGRAGTGNGGVQASSGYDGYGRAEQNPPSGYDGYGRGYGPSSQGAPPDVAPAPASQGAPPLVCADCGAKIKPAERDYSEKTFGRALCRSCQQGAKTAGQE
jgi:hypothetical protein